MYFNKGKIERKEVAGIRCAVVESGCTADRMNFLKKLLEHNRLEVQTEEEPQTDENTQALTYTVGVTDVTFHAVIAVYERRLRTFKGNRVTPDYWNQLTDEIDSWYWRITPENKE